MMKRHDLQGMTLCFVVLAALATSPARAAGQSQDLPVPADATVLHSTSGPHGLVTVVLEGPGQDASRETRLEQYRHGELMRSLRLDFEPAALQVAEESKSVMAVGRIGTSAELRAMVIPASGEPWQPTETLHRVQLSSEGDHVLTQTGRPGGEVHLRLYTAGGTPVAEVKTELEIGEEAALSPDGQAILVTPSAGDSGRSLRLYDVPSGVWEMQRLPEGEMVEHAVPLDRKHVLSVGAGKLRLHVFKGASDQGWSMRPDEDGYTTLRGVSRRGRVALAARGMGRYDLVDFRGEILFRLRLLEDTAELIAALDLPPGEEGQAVLRRLQPELLPSGELELTDFRTGRQYLLDWRPGQGSSGVSDRVSATP